MSVKSENKFLLLSFTISLAVTLASCSQNKAGEDSAASKNGSPAGQGSATSEGTTSKEGATGENGSNKKAKADDPSELPQIGAAAQKINLKDMPDNLVICTVAGQPITIGEYRRQMKTRQRQFQDQMALNPGVAQPFVAEGKRRKVELTAEEKQRLLDAAKIARGSTPDQFRKFLKMSNMTEKQFDELVLEEGLATKVFRQLQDEVLLKDMVDRELLSSAGRSNGFATTAFTRFMEFKKSPNYEEGLKRSGLSEDLYKDDLIKNFLVLYMEDKISKESPVTDEIAKSFYDSNQNMFKHGDRIKFSQILVAAPIDDYPPLEGIKTKIVRLKPTISPTELEEAIKAKKAELKSRAVDLLNRARKGENFATLANEFTDDLRARAAKTGGDTGYQEIKSLVEDKRNKFDKLKPGEIYPEVIEDDIGFFIVKVTDRQGPGVLPFAEIKETLKRALGDTNAQDAVNRWIKEKRRTTEITLSPTFQALIASTARASN